MEESRIVLKEINIADRTVRYNFFVSDNLRKYFKVDEAFEITYDFPLASIPDSIMAIPFICNVLPIAWIMDSKVYCGELDESFYKSIDTFKEGYVKQYPEIHFSGGCNPQKIVRSKTITNLDRDAVCFFSGGVDATTTMLQHLGERPMLCTLWGADLMPENEEGFSIVDESNMNTAKEFGLEYVTIKSTFRKFINEGELHRLVNSYNKGYGWYHDFSHGIGIISHAAPLTYNYGRTTVFIASTSYDEQKGFYCASMPFIDENLKWNDVKVFHDAYEYSRQDKIDYIVNYARENNLKIPLRVCWKAQDGRNCCCCEKCYRTIAGLLLADGDPREFGFDFPYEKYPEIIAFLKKTEKIDVSWLGTYKKCVEKEADDKYSGFSRELASLNISNWKGADRGHKLYNPGFSN